MTAGSLAAEEQEALALAREGWHARGLLSALDRADDALLDLLRACMLADLPAAQIAAVSQARVDLSRALQPDVDRALSVLRK